MLMSANKYLELRLMTYNPVTFDEQAWRGMFHGIEQVSGDQSAHAYLESRSWNAMYNPKMQLRDNPTELFLLTPIWKSYIWPDI